MKHTVFITLVVLGAASLTAGIATARAAGGDATPVFEELDANADGQVTREEISAARQARFAATDSNGDGALSLEELTAQVEERAKKRAERMLERRDANGDGVLSEDELGPDRRAEARFDRLDQDGDGSLSKAEFEAARDKMKRRMGHGPKN